MLLRRWQHARRGEGCAVMLTGEPGIAKSHIALALDGRLHAEPHITVRQFCLAHHTSSALYPFIRQLERAARFERSELPAEKFAKLEALLVRSGADADRVVLPLANLLSLPPSDRYRMPELSPQKRKERHWRRFWPSSMAWRRDSQCSSSVEDVHWADPTSLELLTMTLEQVTSFGCYCSSPRGQSSRRPGQVMRM